MREADAQVVLLVKAFEEADQQGLLLTSRDRARATEAARGEVGEFDGHDGERAGALLVARARRLLPALEQEVPQLQGVLSGSRLGAGLAPLLVLVAALIGLGTNALGPQGHINILAAPLLGFVAWNLAVYLALAVFASRGLAARLRGRRAARAERRRGRGASGGGERGAGGDSRPARDVATGGAKAGLGAGAAAGASPGGAGATLGAGARAFHGGGAASGAASGAALDAARRATGFAARWAAWLVERALSRARVRQVRHQALIGAALTRYAGEWRQAAVPLIGARLHLLLHVGAATLVAAAVTGMYVRGLGLEYRASWQSTFLDAGAVDALLAVVLGPAAAVLGRELPSVEPFRHPASDAAAGWIHLYALTGLLFVIVPRALLALEAALRARRLSAHLALSLEGAWFRSLLAPSRGGAARVDVQPCALRLQPRASERLASLLHDLFGSRAEVVVHGPLAYGDDPAALPASDAVLRCRALLFGLAATPEAEVHGRLAKDLAHALSEGERLLLLVDASGYAQRVGEDSPRLAERRRAWDRVLREAGLTAAHVHLGGEPGPEQLEALGRALYPAAAPETA